MSHRSRVLSSIDMMRLSTAVARPGIDPRTWCSLAILMSDPYIETYEGEQDIFVDIMLMPSQEQETARVGAVYAGNGFGFYFPLKKNDEVLVCAPNGDPDEGIVVTQRMWSPSDPPPSELTVHPEDVTLVVESGKNLRLTVKGSGNIVLNADAGKVYLGSETDTEPVAKGQSLKDYLDAIVSVFNDHGHDYNVGGANLITSRPKASPFPATPPGTGTDFPDVPTTILATTTEVK